MLMLLIITIVFEMIYYWLLAADCQLDWHSIKALYDGDFRPSARLLSLAIYYYYYYYYYDFYYYYYYYSYYYNY